MASPVLHGTLVANTPMTFTFSADFGRVEVLNVDGAAEMYFTTDGTVPTVGGTGCHCLPAAIGAVERAVEIAGNTVIKVISAGTPKVSVTAL